jgi:hypothetical protein
VGELIKQRLGVCLRGAHDGSVPGAGASRQKKADEERLRTIAAAVKKWLEADYPVIVGHAPSAHEVATGQGCNQTSAQRPAQA